ncbi:hypothetical protein M514_02178 [Trichuris suis]|uniref:Peptidase A2 domain-containing protein n=1 Tax=Trichuris suis TaxID=68888 RepID=A0A085MI75_9BILA|nr:hypothetical protein M513_02178 [Trichuris suis]KFD66162.1 hypothetical protein M514_02178 [Trichuris suis]
MVRNSSARKKTYALLDSGSEASLITECLARKLGLSLKPTGVCLTTFKDRQPIPTLTVSFEVASCEGTYAPQVSEAFTANGVNLFAQKNRQFSSEGQLVSCRRHATE